MASDEPRDDVQPQRKQRRRDLRQTATKAERLIWSGLRNRRLGGLKFRRQHSIGPYIVDFCCVERKLVVELDGQYHEYVEAADRRRQRYLEAQGYEVLRYSNEDVLADAEAVLMAIGRHLTVPPHPNPLPPPVAGELE